ncbi:hypothetical protein WUBG_03947 [Wuchereria bancrofti]|uniref:Uncharacterized protein n=1 Tax=Wuchereria bancrofti TaxID=6293 RepID=J9F6L2_WUCBA|nr:hypothetical protein WUBG_03947 [Wuchereria bancrofti]
MSGQHLLGRTSKPTTTSAPNTSASAGPLLPISLDPLTPNPILRLVVSIKTLDKHRRQSIVIVDMRDRRMDGWMDGWMDGTGDNLDRRQLQQRTAKTGVGCENECHTTMTAITNSPATFFSRSFHGVEQTVQFAF